MAQYSTVLTIPPVNNANYVCPVILEMLLMDLHMIANQKPKIKIVAMSATKSVRSTAMRAGADARYAYI